DLDRRLGGGRGLFAGRNDRSFRQRHDLAARPRTTPAAAPAAAADSPEQVSARNDGSGFRKLFSVFRKYRLTAIRPRHILIWSRPERGAWRNVTKRGAGCGGR